MGLFGGNSGTVGPTAQETALSSNMMAQWRDYQSRWLPVQQHLADVVNDMANPQAWQRQEAEGKGNVDISTAFRQIENQQTASAMVRGINPGSSAFKLGVTGAAVAEAQAKGLSIEKGNQDIDRAYVENLKAITNAGSKLAQSSVQGQSFSAEVGSREALSNAQTSNERTSGIISSIGLGLSPLGSQAGMSSLRGAGQGISEFFSQAGMPGSPYGGSGSFATSTPEVTSSAGGITTNWLK